MTSKHWLSSILGIMLLASAVPAMAVNVPSVAEDLGGGPGLMQSCYTICYGNNAGPEAKCYENVVGVGVVGGLTTCAEWRAKQTPGVHPSMSTDMLE